MSRLRDIGQRLRPYRDVIVFAVTLLVANQLWKWMITGDETAGATEVLWLGMDVTALFDRIAQHTARVVYAMTSVFRDTLSLADGNLLRYANGHSTCIVWACTPVKQAFIWLCLMLTTAGEWRSKAWFIPLGWVLIYLFNILRIFAIVLVIEAHPELFTLLHTYILKYVFYGLMFLLWVVYVERVRKPRIF